MNSTSKRPAMDVLRRLHAEALAITALPEEAAIDCDGDREELVARHLDKQIEALPGRYESLSERHVTLRPEFGNFLYNCARACSARRVVEFGTLLGLSTIYLGCALRDNGGGQLICMERSSAGAARLHANVAAAGLGDLVEIRVSESLEMLKHTLDGDVDLVLLDGAITFHLSSLALLEPRLSEEALVIGESAIDQELACLPYSAVRRMAGLFNGLACCSMVATFIPRS